MACFTELDLQLGREGRELAPGTRYWLSALEECLDWACEFLLNPQSR